MASALVFASVVAVAARAQDAPAPRRRGMTVTVNPGAGFQVERRGRLGINVDIRPDASRDSVGARVAGVTPGGAAERAGVQTGDVITRLNGTRLTAADNASSEDGDAEQSRPALRLLRIASRLEPGDTVRLDVRRDSRPMTFTFTAEASDVDRIVQRFRIPGPGGETEPGGSIFQSLPGMEDGSMRVFAFGSPVADLELVKVNAGLGEYFGTTEGLLVVDVGQDTALGLRAGDVILSIGGRRATTPPQAMRILGTYEANESVAFEVMRQKHRVTVNGKMPAESHGWRTYRNSFEWDGLPELQPAAPAAPAMPAAPLMPAPAAPTSPRHPSVVRIVMDEEV
jgi:S1-C subfamily serine protease